MDSLVRAPELESPLGWLNTDRGLRVADELRGRVVLLDFWTFCCINCIHILPDLKYLENKYRNDPLVVIGVHSAKFTNEASRQTIRAAIHRYEIEHPVIVDDGMTLWRAYGVRSWPTFVLIDPQGYVVQTLSGEGQRDALDGAIAQLLEVHRQRGTLADRPPALRRDAVVEPASGLAFPGKVLADADGGRVFISDTNHNRIVVATWPDEQGRCRLVKTIGWGAAGRSDGSADVAEFDHPQGLALLGATLYVADTENHLIRAVDCNDWTVTTVVGTGEMGYDRAGGGMGVQQAISSPWDLASEGGTVYVAMAGLHQIWRVEMPIGFARALAGSGRENIVDGPVETAALSQPSGICLHRGKLYVADSEVSAIRGIDLAAETVFTVIGQGLFVFGDVDGVHPKAKLQHCLGVAPWGGKLLVADSYNHKIKIVDPAARSATTLYGTGKPGPAASNEGLALHEPGGLDVAGDTLFVADTNNHRIVRVDLKTNAWAELKIDGLSAAPKPADSQQPASTAIDVEPVAIAPDTELRLNVRLPEGAHLNADAPWTVRVSAQGEVLVQLTGYADAFPITIKMPAGVAGQHPRWDVALSLVYCTDGEESLCIPADVHWRVPVTQSGSGKTEVELSAVIASPS